jgi:molecular chaperone GrpE
MTQDPPIPADPSAGPTEGEDEDDAQRPQSPAEVEALSAGDEPADDDLAARLIAAEASLAELNDKYLRKAAELENTKRRLLKQVDETKRYGVEEVVKEMLPVLDDLELALGHANEQGQRASGDSLLDGMNLVKRKFASVIERYGAVPFDSLGKPFDPKVHEAISQQETDQAPDGSVLGEYLKGYMLHDRLLRPALVIVARNPSDRTPQAGG